MKPEEIRKLTADEIQAKLTDEQDELMKLRFRQVTGQLTDTSRLRILRRNIARYKTLYREVLAGPAKEVKSEPKKESKPKPKTRAKARVKAESKAEEGEA